MSDPWSSMTGQDEFERVFNALARYNRRPKPLTREERLAAEKEARKKNPKHIKALERRKKRKRGGPK